MLMTVSVLVLRVMMKQRSPTTPPTRRNLDTAPMDDLALDPRSA